MNKQREREREKGKGKGTNLEGDHSIVIGVLDDGLEAVQEDHVRAVVRKDVAPGVQHAQHAQLRALRIERTDEAV